MTEWVVLELSPKSEGEDPDIVRDALLRILKGGEIFIPAAVTAIGNDRAVHYLVEGYAFAKRNLPDNAFFKLEGTRYVQSVLLRPGNQRHQRLLATVTDEHVAKLRRQMEAEVNQGIGVGDTVVITSGHYKHIEAMVIEEIVEQEAVQVFIKLRSKQTIVTLPRSFLQITARSPLSPLLGRLSNLRAWIQGASPVLKWQDTFGPIQEAYRQYTEMEGWITTAKPTYSFLRWFKEPRKPELLLPKVEELERLQAWHRASQAPYRLQAAAVRVMSPEVESSLESKLLEFMWFEDALSRGRLIRAEINALLKKIVSRKAGEGRVQNIVVDGHNLAFRCLYAPGMSQLADSSGRPTGVILGFIRSLGALRKKYPGAALCITWDGSSQRRKAKYSEYKGNRPSHGSAPTFDQIGWLRDHLPFLGCYQAYNPDEEADDVIATLCRKKFSSQKTVIFSTDRDMLQLVTPNLTVLIPAIGSRREMLLGPAEVEELYGVPPDKVLQLRALTGDTSDNIPGVPRVPKKILRALVQAHGTVDGIYRSGLAGLTKVQYDRLRSAEPQVRINLDLLALNQVPVTWIEPDPAPDTLASRLAEIEINPNQILETFFGRPPELTEETLSL